MTGPCFQRFVKYFTDFINKSATIRTFNTVKRYKQYGRVILAVETIKISTVNSEGRKLSGPDPSCLTHTYLIRNAAVASLTSATTLLTQTFSSLVDAMDTYNESALELYQLYELSLQALGNQFMEDQIWDHILKARTELNTCRTQKQELETMYMSAEKVVESSAEAAFIAGAESVSISASELVHSYKLQYKQHATKSQTIEERLVEVEVKSIEEISKREEKKEQKIDIKTLNDLPEYEEGYRQGDDGEDIKGSGEGVTDGDMEGDTKAEGFTEEEGFTVGEGVTESDQDGVKLEAKEDDEEDTLKDWFDFGKERYQEEEDMKAKNEEQYS